MPCFCAVLPFKSHNGRALARPPLPTDLHLPRHCNPPLQSVTGDARPILTSNRSTVPSRVRHTEACPTERALPHACLRAPSCRGQRIPALLLQQQSRCHGPHAATLIMRASLNPADLPDATTPAPNCVSLLPTRPTLCAPSAYLPHAVRPAATICFATLNPATAWRPTPRRGGAGRHRAEVAGARRLPRTLLHAAAQPGPS